ALFVRCFRYGRAGEFLETRIIPERIEHWIEPEQSGSQWRNLSEKLSLYCFGASEATIFSKRGSPRRGSHWGGRRRSPQDGAYGSLLTLFNCSNARSFSPVQA